MAWMSPRFGFPRRKLHKTPSWKPQHFSVYLKALCRRLHYILTVTQFHHNSLEMEILQAVTIKQQESLSVNTESLYQKEKVWRLSTKPQCLGDRNLPRSQQWQEMESPVHRLACLCVLLAQGENTVTPKKCKEEEGKGRFLQKQEKIKRKVKRKP